MGRHNSANGSKSTNWQNLVRAKYFNLVLSLFQIAWGVLVNNLNWELDFSEKNIWIFDGKRCKQPTQAQARSLWSAILAAKTNPLVFYWVIECTWLKRKKCSDGILCCQKLVHLILISGEIFWGRVVSSCWWSRPVVPTFKTVCLTFIAADLYARRWKIVSSYFSAKHIWNIIAASSFCFWKFKDYKIIHSVLYFPIQTSS